MRLRFAAAALLAGLALVGAGCGGGSKPSAAGGEGAASIVPASAPIYASVDTSMSSDQWKALDALLDKFPGKDTILREAREAAESDTKVRWKTDVKPALGDEFDVAVLDLEAGTNIVGLLQPKDEGAFARLVKKTNAEAKKPTDKIYVLDYKGWKVIADGQAKLDRFEQAAGSGSPLADDPTFKDATGTLSEDALAKVYANGTKIFDRLEQVLPQLAGSKGQGRIDWAAAELVAKDDGLSLDGSIKSSGTKSKEKPYEAKLLDAVPAGALVFASFSGNGSARAQVQDALRTATGLPPQLRPLVTLFARLGPLFAHENAFYVRAGAAFVPEVTLVTQPDNPTRGVATIDRIVASLAKTVGIPLRARPVTIAGGRFKELNLGRVSIFYGEAGGKVIVTDAQRAVSDLQGGGEKLRDDATFKDAKAASGLPDKTGGFVYLNLKDGIPLVESLAQLGGAQPPPLVADNLRPLRSFTAWATSDGDVSKFAAFLEIK
jgi:hypothetical protein